MSDREKHDQGAELIRKAFAVARDSGSHEWATMTTAVLKNRLLDITDRSFAEREWGASSFAVFLDQFDDVITVDTSVRPAKVTLRQDAGSPAPGLDPDGRDRGIGPRRRVRRDLWEAVLDYSSGNRYRWDGKGAVPVEPGEASNGTTFLPTLTKAEFKSWRSEFVRRESAQSLGAAPFLRRWLQHEQPLTALPPAFRIPWIVELKRQVLERLETWFHEQEIEPPDDLVVSEAEPVEPGKAEGEDLRESVLALVREMTQAELEAVQLPASVLFRVKR